MNPSSGWDRSDFFVMLIICSDAHSAADGGAEDTDIPAWAGRLSVAAGAAAGRGRLLFVGWRV